MSKDYFSGFETDKNTMVITCGHNTWKAQTYTLLPSAFPAWTFFTKQGHARPLRFQT